MTHDRLYVAGSLSNRCGGNSQPQPRMSESSEWSQWRWCCHRPQDLPTQPTIVAGHGHVSAKSGFFKSPTVERRVGALQRVGVEAEPACMRFCVGTRLLGSGCQMIADAETVAAQGGHAGRQLAVPVRPFNVSGRRATGGGTAQG